MTREEVKKILGEDATDVQITNFLNYHHSFEKTKNDEINGYKNTINEHSDYDNIKKELDDLKKANMTNEELLVEKQKELDNALAKAKEEETKFQKKQNSLEAKSILMDAGITDEKELSGILNSISSDNKDATILNANNIANSIKSIKEATEKTVKEKLMNGEPNPSADGGKKADSDDTMTKDKFNNLLMENFEKAKEWKDNHAEEYQKLMNN